MKECGISESESVFLYRPTNGEICLPQQPGHKLQKTIIVQNKKVRNRIDLYIHMVTLGDLLMLCVVLQWVELREVSTIVGRSGDMCSGKRRCVFLPQNKSGLS